jgi:hypothetical protein
MQNIEWRRVTWYSQAIAVILFVAVFALGFYLGRQYQAASVLNGSAATSTPALGESRFTAYLTAYTYWDNTPPGSSDISNPIVHQKAGGTGTYTDPITVAVGHILASSTDTLDYPAGTKFYIPNLRKYFIVEDTCGDGPTPQNGPCHTGFEGHPWLDLWLGGKAGTKATTDACANAVTDLHLVILKPRANYAVEQGAIFETTCAKQFGDTPVTV